MKAPFGATSVEFFALRFRPDELVADIMVFVDTAVVTIRVNGEVRATASLISLPMEPPMSGRFVFRPSLCPCKEGDDIGVWVESEGARECGGRLEVELSIAGEITADDNDIQVSDAAMEGLLGADSPYPTILTIESGEKTP